ncbi:MAG: nucleotidyl transferase AbiEii/AbiGii toxin family protein [Gammaproteobacteria bacterium]|nr:nucleotidyl transferase AbiEii/AbiGii toxin family protein [Gammaproteobacteria bacterium]
MSKGKRNIAASVRQKLKNQAAQDKRPFAELLQYYAMERFLYRLTQSSHAGRFVLKGALMLRVWQSPQFRPTMDIDMLGRTSNDIDDICAQVAAIISVKADDGLIFDSATIRGERIKEDADYEGVRVRFIGTLDNARVNMQIDVSFGDIIHPEPIEAELPGILDSPVPRLLCYSCESAIAEKFEAMIKLETLNSRMKDFYDIWLLSRQFEFDGSELAEAIRLTLENRGTEIPDIITAFTDEFVMAKDKQWAAFCKRLNLEHVPASFVEVVAGVEGFLQPIASALSVDEQFSQKWSVSDYWASP